MYNDCSIGDRAHSKRFFEELQYMNVANPLEYGLYAILETIWIVCDYSQTVGIVFSWLLELFTVLCEKKTQS